MIDVQVLTDTHPHWQKRRTGYARTSMEHVGGGVFTYTFSPRYVWEPPKEVMHGD